MAKGKQAAALFEVIHGSRHVDRAAGRGLLRTPKWWFKRRANNLSSASTGSAATAGPLRERAAPPEGALASGAGGIEVNVDPDGQHVTLRFSYTAAAIVVFTIGVTVVLAYLAGRQMRQGESNTLISPVTTSELRAGPPQPSVLDLPPRSPAAASAPDPEPAGDDASVASPLPLIAEPAPQWNDPRPPATLVVDDAARNIGLNYVVVQSYADEKLAAEAAGVLKSNGIDCTIERGLKGWPAAWHIVVGTRGFNRISSPEFKDYLKKIQTVSKIFAPKGGYKAFQPTAYKWDREK